MATDQKVRENIKNEMKCTKIIAAQRIGTIHNADKIIVIDKGAIVQIGKHQELMETCDIYKQIALSQLTGKELEHVK
jgi:ATP-binding cassette subfamily B protein